jgi:hypothetical protein
MASSREHQAQRSAANGFRRLHGQKGEAAMTEQDENITDNDVSIGFRVFVTIIVLLIGSLARVVLNNTGVDIGTIGYVALTVVVLSLVARIWDHRVLFGMILAFVAIIYLGFFLMRLPPPN